MQPTALFCFDDFQVHLLDESDVTGIQTVFEDSNDFSWLVAGQPSGPQEGEEFLIDLPPGKSGADKFPLGVLDGEQRLTGVLDVVRDYPEPGVWFIGLLLFPPQQRGGGLGRRTVEALCTWLRAQDAQAVMLGVVGENQAGLRFWERAGFTVVDQRPPRRFGQKEQIVLVMRRPLT